MKSSIKPTFKANDGQVFATEEEANRRNRLLAANQRIERWIRRSVYHAAKSFKTADGYFLDYDKEYSWTSLQSEFYFISNRSGSWPTVISVSIYLRYVDKVKIFKDGTDAEITLGNTGHELKTFRVSELYRYKKMALQAAAAKCAEEIERMEKYRKELLVDAMRERG